MTEKKILVLLCRDLELNFQMLSIANGIGKYDELRLKPYPFLRYMLYIGIFDNPLESDGRLVNFNKYNAIMCPDWAIGIVKFMVKDSNFKPKIIAFSHKYIHRDLGVDILISRVKNINYFAKQKIKLGKKVIGFIVDPYDMLLSKNKENKLINGMSRPIIFAMIGDQEKKRKIDSLSAISLLKRASDIARESNGSIFIATNIKNKSDIYPYINKAMETNSCYFYDISKHGITDSFDDFLNQSDYFLTIGADRRFVSKLINLNKPIFIINSQKKEDLFVKTIKNNGICVLELSDIDKLVLKNYTHSASETDRVIREVKSNLS